jgi:hypothetical protein
MHPKEAGCGAPRLGHSPLHQFGGPDLNVVDDSMEKTQTWVVDDSMEKTQTWVVDDSMEKTQTWIEELTRTLALSAAPSRIIFGHKICVTQICDS